MKAEAVSVLSRSQGQWEWEGSNQKLETVSIAVSSFNKGKRKGGIRKLSNSELIFNFWHIF